MLARSHADVADWPGCVSCGWAGPGLPSIVFVAQRGENWAEALAEAIIIPVSFDVGETNIITRVSVPTTVMLDVFIIRISDSTQKTTDLFCKNI
ncbi:hypothetical protein RRG08_015346 [Elysia crispata]|uniref:Uncharacterized protein n=1 Tax=Elysia crispata TaxID=231223 RepID=A0AAE1A9A6_9GAST|nr:hypothetical protein RRG08_015346 [Elysia crispata]